MRKIIHIFLSLVIVYAGTVSAYANSSIGGWTATDTIIAGANTTINAIKNGANGALKSAVTVAPQASKVGKFLIKGGGTAALLIAVPQLIGDGVDWVLDPANNAVRYTDPAAENSSTHQYLAVYKKNSDFLYPFTASTREAAALGNCLASGNVFSHMNSNTSFTCNTVNGAWAYNGTILLNPSYDPDAPSEEYKYLPIDTVAAKVISNAEAGHAPSQEAVKAVALEGFAAGEHDAALDAAAEPTTDTDNPPDTTNPDNPDAPAEPAPFDPSGIIAAIAALKALLAGILSSITGLSDLFNDTPPEKTKQETDVPVEAPPDVKNPNEFDVDYIGFSSQCPTLSPFSVAIGGASSSMTFDMTPLCNLAVTIRPAIIAIAYFIGLGVIASAIRET